MNAITDTNPREPGISLRMLLVAVTVTAVVTGTAAWLLLGPEAAGPNVAEEHAGELPPGVVELTPDAQKNAALGLMPVAVRPLPTTIDVTGSVAAEDARVAHIRPLARGLIERVWVSLGERVTTGQPLATYDNIQLGELVGEYLGARAVLRQAEADLDVKRRMVERGRALITLEAIAQQTLDLREAELKTAEAGVARDQAAVSRVEEQLHRFGLSDADLRQLSPTEGTSPHRDASHAVLRAPFDGVVTKYDVAQGEVAEPERELFTVTDLSSVWVLADVYEKDITKVRAGTDAVVRVDAYPDQTFAGRVTYVSDLIEPQTRSAKARVVVANPGTLLKLDMFARVSIPTAEQREGLLVPVAAVQSIDNQPVVFVQQSANRFVRRDVELGMTAGELVEIRAGVQAGDTVVGAGSFYLKTALLRERIGDEH
ncbi:MAG: efflux RND transporter periplasmic adaptor subunit [Acidobacteria bacterium]|nr:efflux RND transporter periplasmic adaptor subunit [Acidobacteriota bacterium]